MGQGAGEMSLYKNTLNLIGKKFQLGSQELDNGIDCFTLIVTYLRNRGVDIPKDETFKGLTFDSYKNEYLKDKTLLMQTAVEYLKSKTDKITNSQVTAGDILLIKSHNGNLSFGIDTGNGSALSISESDGVVSLSKNDFKVIEAFRCRA